ncbi:MAG: ribonuclease HI family protein [bacterium]|nr:ribonuclease HI family protein [bacterium]
MTDPLEVTLHVDGASKGNPGHAGIGVLAESDGVTLTEFSDYIGQTTNNTAEYRALIKGLEIAQSLGAEAVSVISDSELIVKQINGSYRVKNASLRPLYQEARQRSDTFKSFQIRHVPRSENKQADRLANEGILNGKGPKT